MILLSVIFADKRVQSMEMQANAGISLYTHPPPFPHSPLQDRGGIIREYIRDSWHRGLEGGNSSKMGKGTAPPPETPRISSRLTPE